MAHPPGREMEKRDEERSTTERPVKADEHDWSGNDTAHAVPGCTWRPGSRN
jgi:hypothetical protein